MTCREAFHDMTANTEHADMTVAAPTKLPIDRTENAEPMLATEQKEPTLPMDSTDPTLPIESTELRDLMDSTDWVD
jgi:hypothetical protein